MFLLKMSRSSSRVECIETDKIKVRNPLLLNSTSYFRDKRETMRTTTTPNKTRPRQPWVCQVILVPSVKTLSTSSHATIGHTVNDSFGLQKLYWNDFFQGTTLMWLTNVRYSTSVIQWPMLTESKRRSNGVSSVQTRPFLIRYGGQLSLHFRWKTTTRLLNVRIFFEWLPGNAKF